MDISTIIVAAIALVGTLTGSFLSNSKTTSLILYRIGELEKKVEKHNSIVERTYKLEECMQVHEEKLRVANHRIEDLEKEGA